MAGNPRVRRELQRKSGNGDERPSGSRAGDGAGRAPGTAEERYRMIAAAAYFRAEKRGFAPGHEIEDWLAAEREVDDGLLHGDRLVERLRTERDELRVRIHLAKLELRQEWDALEHKWEMMRARSGGALREARGAGKEVGAVAGALLREIREGYERIRAAL